MPVSPAPKRRTILKGAAWSTPVIAAAIGSPAASASESGGDLVLPNAVADFFWAASAAAEFTTLSALAGEQQVTYSTQISYRSDLWRSPSGQFLLSITFNVPVTLQALPASWTQIVPSAGAGTATTFSFLASASSGGHNLNAKFVPSEPAHITAVSSMSLIHGGATTWAREPAVSTADFAP